MRITALLATLGVVVALAGQSNADEINWGKVDAALGKTASVQGDVHRYGIPRSDLQVTVDGVTIKPALATRRLAWFRAGDRRRGRHGRSRANRE
jgi:hypothetical protein